MRDHETAAHASSATVMSSGTVSVRLVLYSGKGGVGKTSLSAATAIRAAKLGRRHQRGAAGGQTAVA